jgi:hypothetical protein
MARWGALLIVSKCTPHLPGAYSIITHWHLLVQSITLAGHVCITIPWKVLQQAYQQNAAVQNPAAISTNSERAFKAYHIEVCTSPSSSWQLKAGSRRIDQRN